MTVGSLFAGIGGFDLGFERAGYDIRWQVEIDPWARAVLAKHWPHVHRHDDIRTANASNLEAVDVLCGGFPCQDISLAGKGAGIADGTRSGLWFEYARLIRELRPRYVVVENVAALLARGLGRVLGDLAACGYDAEWDCIPAAAVGAPHRRDRLWLVAYPKSATGWWREEQGQGGYGRSRVDGANGDVADADSGRCEQRHSGEWAVSVTHTGRADVAYTDGRGCEWRGQPERADEQGARGGEPDGCGGLRGRQSDAAAHVSDAWGERGQVSPARRDTTGQEIFGRGGETGSLGAWAGWWATEPNVGRVVDGLPRRVDRLRGLGNAIVPQIAEWIAGRIADAEARRVA